MFKKTMKRALCGILALTATISSVGLFTACETTHPQVEIQLRFNGVTYTLDYTLYRQVAPATVKHFLTLAENRYYDGLCVHDYADSRLYTGAYSYTKDGADGGLTYKKYYDFVKTYENFPHTVWLDSAKTLPSYTLKGEFEDNDFNVENGAKKQTYGSLTMYYTEKESVNVTVKRENADSEGNMYSLRDYKYNSATSQFFISLTTKSSLDSSYCTFGALGTDGKTELEDLEAAIEAYLEDEEEFTTSVTLDIDTDDYYAKSEENTATYNVPVQPIEIVYVKVTKW